MNKDFNKVTERYNRLSKAESFNRMSELQAALVKQKTVVANFNKKADVKAPKEEADFMSNMVFNFVMFSPIAAFLSAKFAIIGAFNANAVSYAEGLSVVVEDKEQSRKGKSADYPEGRVAFKVASRRPEKKFDIAFDARKPRKDDKFARQDRKEMYELLDMMRKLEKGDMVRPGFGEEKAALEKNARDDKNLRGLGEYMRAAA